MMSSSQGMNLLDTSYLALTDGYVRSAIEACDQSNEKERSLVVDLKRILEDLNASAEKYGADSKGHCVSPHTGAIGPWTVLVEDKAELNTLGYLSECTRQWKFHQETMSSSGRYNPWAELPDEFLYPTPGPITSEDLVFLHDYVYKAILTVFDLSNAKERELVDLICSNQGLVRNSDGTFIKKPKKSVNTNANKGCYIATCVYGSYDCPEVWVLRRFRDQKLSTSLLGRQFVRFYYAVSPKFVQKFGQITWLRRSLRFLLDYLVHACQAAGISNDFYFD